MCWSVLSMYAIQGTEKARRAYQHRSQYCRILRYVILVMRSSICYLVLCIVVPGTLLQYNETWLNERKG
jgi:hypothetical protein